MENIDFSTLLSKEYYIGKDIPKKVLLGVKKLTKRQEMFVRIYCEKAEILYKISEENCLLSIDESGVNEIIIIKVKLTQDDIHKNDLFALAYAFQKLINYNTLFIFETNDNYSLCCSINHLSKILDARIVDKTAFTYGLVFIEVKSVFDIFNNIIHNDKLSFVEAFYDFFRVVNETRIQQSKSFRPTKDSVFNSTSVPVRNFVNCINEQDFFCFEILKEIYKKAANYDLDELDELLLEYCDNYNKEDYYIKNVNEHGISLYDYIDIVMQFIEGPIFLSSRFGVDDFYIFADWFEKFEFVDDYYRVIDNSLDEEDSDTTKYAEELICLIQECR